MDDSLQSFPKISKATQSFHSNTYPKSTIAMAPAKRLNPTDFTMLFEEDSASSSTTVLIPNMSDVYSEGGQSLSS